MSALAVLTCKLQSVGFWKFEKNLLVKPIPTSSNRTSEGETWCKNCNVKITTVGSLFWETDFVIYVSNFDAHSKTWCKNEHVFHVTPNQILRFLRRFGSVL